MVSATDPYGRILGFLDRHVYTCLYISTGVRYIRFAGDISKSIAYIVLDREEAAALVLLFSIHVSKLYKRRK
jgi:hypothetical protein